MKTLWFAFCTTIAAWLYAFSMPTSPGADPLITSIHVGDLTIQPFVIALAAGIIPVLLQVLLHAEQDQPDPQPEPQAPQTFTLENAIKRQPWYRSSVRRSFADPTRRARPRQVHDPSGRW